MKADDTKGFSEIKCNECKEIVSIIGVKKIIRRVEKENRYKRKAGISAAGVFR